MNMNSYQILKETHQKECDSFPMFFAFSNQQFENGMRKFGLNPTDIDKIYKLGDSGGFYRREDAQRLHDMWDRHGNEMQAAIDADTIGQGFIFDMFNYELSNHEFVVTHDITDTLDALGLTIEEVRDNKKLLHGLNKAIKAQGGKM